MVKKVSLRDLAMTVNEFEGTVRAQLGHSARAGDVLVAIDTIRQALGGIGHANKTDDVLYLSDQIICGAKKDRPA